jgi:hypothetical protein
MDVLRCLVNVLLCLGNLLWYLVIRLCCLVEQLRKPLRHLINLSWQPVVVVYLLGHLLKEMRTMFYTLRPVAYRDVLRPEVVAWLPPSDESLLWPTIYILQPAICTLQPVL